MKYHASTLNGKHYVQFPGFGIVTETRFGADKLAEEFNRLDHLATERDKELVVQIEAKCNALRKVTDLEALGVEMELKLKGTPTSRALKQRLDIRTGQVHELLTVLERCQNVLAAYVQPEPRLKPKVALQDLLDVLDDGKLVEMMRNLRQLIGVKDNGSVELTKADKLAVLKALDELAGFLTKFTPMQPASYTEACRILVASEDGDVANGCHKKLPEVGDEMIVTLKRGSDGKQYVSGFGVSTGPYPTFTVQADQVYINGACIEESSVSATELGTAIHEGLERVVNNTTNHFGPDEKLKRKNRKLKARVSELENERDELLSEIRACGQHND